MKVFDRTPILWLVLQLLGFHRVPTYSHVLNRVPDLRARPSPPSPHQDAPIEIPMVIVDADADDAGL